MKAQQAILVIAWLCLPLFGGAFSVAGRIEPPAQGSVSLHGVSTPFAVSTLSSKDGRFQFSRIEAGSYTVIVFLPGRGETRSTIDVGPGTANDKGSVNFTIHIDEAQITPHRADSKVSIRELSIPDRARNESAAADKCLAKHDPEGAIAHLKNAVRLAPQFSAAWNHLGTIAYKNREYPQAAEYFKKSLAADPDAYEPLVNLGGVLLSLGQVQAAWDYNVHAVLRRPNDALANSQLGMTYMELGKADLALKYLNEARRLDPGHFSHPQLMAAEIYLRRKQNAEAAAALDEFLRHHPDWPAAAKMRETIEKLRAPQ